MTITQNLNEADSSGQVAKTELRDMMEKNLKMTEEMHAMMKKMDKFIFWSKVSSLLKFVIIILPLILSYFLLSPMLKSAFTQYQDLLGETKNSNLNGLPAGLQNLIPKK